MGDRPGAAGVRAAYDAVAEAYDSEYRNELDGKPLDRALLTGFVELVGAGRIADVGCGPGHVTRFLAEQHADVIGIDVSPRMIEISRLRAPGLTFMVGSMLQLPFADGDWAGVVALYSIIHLDADARAIACREFARVIRPGSWLLLGFHVDSDDFVAGRVNHVTSWLGQPVELDGYFLDPSVLVIELETAGFTVMVEVRRQPDAAIEYPSTTAVDRDLRF